MVSNITPSKQGVGRTIYVFLGSCGHSHALDVEFDMISYMKTRGEMPLKFREVKLKSGSGMKIDKIIFDDYIEPTTSKEPHAK